MFMFSKRGGQLIQLSYFYSQSCSLSAKASKVFGFLNEASPSSSVEYKRGVGNVSSSVHPFSLLSDSRDNVKDYKIEIVDNQTWGVSAGLADAWRGVGQMKDLRNDVVDEFDAYVPSNDSDPDLDEIEDMRIRGNLFYKLDKDSKEYEEYNHEFLRKKSSKNKGGQNETNTEKQSRNSDPIADRPSKNKDGQKESKMKENVTGFSVGSVKLHNFNENYHLTSSLDQIHGVRDGRKVRTPTFNQITAAYHEPFCLDIYISKASVRACIVHRATSKVVVVAHSISKDMKFDLGSTRNATACAAVGKVLAQRALADDIHNAVYTPRRGEKLEGKLLVVLESVIKNGINVKVKIKQRKFKKSGVAPAARNFNTGSVSHQIQSSSKISV
ncbi:Ribosomal L18p domain-containing protein [Heracleum sosnowskyi]|uniref:Ribosomal L18p domain-containing protein n=1 Tax=Heracleum sosnowskyi TaxID=360622 RepID=A0AAD8IRL5_9APIA|nr:Ribosomal L18p domain-containing protein [Heracleum sosnowskyi]